MDNQEHKEKVEAVLSEAYDSGRESGKNLSAIIIGTQGIQIAALERENAELKELLEEASMIIGYSTDTSEGTQAGHTRYKIWEAIK